MGVAFDLIKLLPLKSMTTKVLTAMWDLSTLNIQDPTEQLSTFSSCPAVYLSDPLSFNQLTYVLILWDSSPYLGCDAHIDKGGLPSFNHILYHTWYIFYPHMDPSSP